MENKTPLNFRSLPFFALVGGGLLITLGLTSCSEEQDSIFRQFDIDTGTSVILDAKQRVVTNAPYERWTKGVPRYVKPSRIVCAEPSPDVTQGISQALTSALTAAVDGTGAVDANFGYASAASIAQLGERLATIQLLRDELADLCRSYANGAIATTNYTIRLAQLDEKMVTLLMAEMASGAFGRDLAAIGGAASNRNSIDPAQIEALREAVKTRTDELENTEQDLDDHLKTQPKNGDEATWQNRVDALNGQIKTKKDALAFAKREYTAASPTMAQSTPQSAGGAGIARVSEYSKIAEQLVHLQTNYLSRGQLGSVVDLCLTRWNEIVLDTEGQKEAGTGETLPEQDEKMLEQAQNVRMQIQELQSESETLENEIKELQAQGDARFDAVWDQASDEFAQKNPGKIAVIDGVENTEEPSEHETERYNAIIEERQNYIFDKTDTDDQLERLDADIRVKRAQRDSVTKQISTLSGILDALSTTPARVSAGLNTFCEDEMPKITLHLREAQDRRQRIQEQRARIDACRDVLSFSVDGLDEASSIKMSSAKADCAEFLANTASASNQIASTTKPSSFSSLDAK